MDGKKNIFDMWKLHKIQTSVSINKILLEHSHTHHTLLSTADFALATIAQLRSYKSDCMFHKSKISPPGWLQKKFAEPWFR